MIATVDQDGPLLRINAPEIYRDAEFIEWLNNPERNQATWHRKGDAPNDWSDLFCTYDGGEGSDADMPEHIWRAIADAVEATGATVAFLWISNVDDCEDQ